MCSNRWWMLTVIGVVFTLAAESLAAAPEEIKEKDSVLSALDARVVQFFEGISLGQAQGAFTDLLSGSQLLKQSDAIKDLIARTNDLEAKYGKYRAFEQISAKRIGNDLVLMRYLYQCENIPVVWHFTFYRTPGAGGTAAKNRAWRIVAVRFDTDLEKL